MNTKILSLISMLVVLILAVGVVAVGRGAESNEKTFFSQKTFTPIEKAEPVVNNWVYVNKAGKATTSHKYCTKRISTNSNAASWGPTVGAYFANGKYGTTWKNCDVARDGTVVATGCVSGKWNYIDGRGIMRNPTPITGCTTMNNKGELNKEKPWCATKVAFVYGDKYGTKKTLCSKKGGM